MTQDRKLPAFMAGQFLHHHTLSFPATRALTVLTVIKVAATGAQQRQCGNHFNSPRAVCGRQITDRRNIIRQIRINNRAILETYDQTDGIQARERQCSIIKFCRNHAPGMRKPHPGDHVGNVFTPAGLLLELLRGQSGPILPEWAVNFHR
ncbi:hypothetical protein KLMIMMO101B1_29205 [Klebsiella michiganensis]